MITDNAALALGSAFTLQAWVRPATDSGEQMILEKRQSYALAFRNGTLQYQLDSELTGTRGIWFDTQLGAPEARQRSRQESISCPMRSGEVGCSRTSRS